MYRYLAILEAVLVYLRIVQLSNKQLDFMRNKKNNKMVAIPAKHFLKGKNGFSSVCIIQIYLQHSNHASMS